MCKHFCSPVHVLFFFLEGAMLVHAILKSKSLSVVYILLNFNNLESHFFHSSIFPAILHAEVNTSVLYVCNCPTITHDIDVCVSLEIFH